MHKKRPVAKCFATGLFCPPGHCGGGLAKPNRGDSAGKACGTSYLFPLHYSLKTFPFPHGFVLWWSANCESLSHASGVPAPFGKGALRRAAADNGHGSFQRIVTAPPVPGIGGLSAEPIPYSLFPEKPLSQKSKIFPAPFHKGAFYFPL